MPTSKPARTDAPCPNEANHTPAPEGYIQWHAWAKRMGRTHEQTRCPGCNLFHIWVPKLRQIKGKP